MQFISQSVVSNQFKTNQYVISYVYLNLFYLFLSIIQGQRNFKICKILRYFDYILFYFIFFTVKTNMRKIIFLIIFFSFPTLFGFQTEPFVNITDVCNLFLIKILLQILEIY